MSDITRQDLIAALLEAARIGDWDTIDSLSPLLPASPESMTEAEAADYLFALRTILIAARTTRADIVKSLHRINAASGFNLCA